MNDPRDEMIGKLNDELKRYAERHRIERDVYDAAMELAEAMDEYEHRPRTDEWDEHMAIEKLSAIERKFLDVCRRAKEGG